MLKRDHQVVLPTQARAPGFRVELKGTTFRLVATGAWTVHEAEKLDNALKRLRVPIPPTPDFTGEMDIAGIAEIDTAGALLLQRTAAAWEKTGLRTRYAGSTEAFRILIEEVQRRSPAPSPRSAQVRTIIRSPSQSSLTRSKRSLPQVPTRCVTASGWSTLSSLPRQPASNGTAARKVRLRYTRSSFLNQDFRRGREKVASRTR